MTTQNLDLVVNKLSTRVRTLEMGRTGGTSGGTGPVTEVVIIDPADPNSPTTLDTVVHPPESVELTAGAFQDDVFIDVEVMPPVSGKAVSFFIILSEKEADGFYYFRDSKNNYGGTTRFTGLKSNTVYGVQVQAMNAIGIVAPLTSMQSITTGSDRTIPPAVTGVQMVRGASSVTVTWNPLTVSQAADVARGKGQYIVQIDTTTAYNSVNLRSSTDSSYVRSFLGINSPNTYNARVAPIDSSGNQGPWVSATPIVAGGVTDNMILAGLNAAKITFGSMDGDRIMANSADISIIKTSRLTSANIILDGGAIQAGSPPTNGILFNELGLRLYRGGVATVVLDAAGTATFSGNINGGTISIGTNALKVDSSGNLWMGAASFGLAPFRVSNAGIVNAMTVTGQITVTGNNRIVFSDSTAFIEAYNVSGIHLNSNKGAHIYLYDNDIQMQGGITNILSSLYVAGRVTQVLRGSEMMADGAGFVVRSINNQPDSNHRLSYVAGIDGPRLEGWSNVELYNRATDATFRLQGDGNAVLYDNGGSWSMKSIGSSANIKQDVATYSVNAISLIQQLRPVQFRYTPTIPNKITELKQETAALQRQRNPSEEIIKRIEDNQKIISALEYKMSCWENDENLGFIAEEVALVEPRAVEFDEHDNPIGIKTGHFSALLVKAVQELIARVDTLEATVRGPQ